MAKKRLTGRVFLSLPPEDTRPVGPLVNDTHPYGQTDVRGNVVSGENIYCSDVMAARGGKEAIWDKGFKTVSSYELARGYNPLLRKSDEEA